MPDIIASGDWGRDDHVLCEWLDPDSGQKRGCGGKTYLIDDQGQGLCAYKCVSCGEEFQVQFDSCDEDEERETDEDYAWMDYDY